MPGRKHGLPPLARQLSAEGLIAATAAAALKELNTQTTMVVRGDELLLLLVVVGVQLGSHSPRERKKCNFSQTVG